MTVAVIDFDDLPEDSAVKEEKITLSLNVSKETRDMFKKIAHRERYKMTELGGIVIENYINDYVEKYKNKNTDK